MAKFTVILERTDTVTKKAEIMIEAELVEQARRFIFADLRIDPGCYDDELRAVKDGIGEMLVKVENQDERVTQFPRAVAGH